MKTKIFLFFVLFFYLLTTPISAFSNATYNYVSSYDYDSELDYVIPTYSSDVSEVTVERYYEGHLQNSESFDVGSSGQAHGLNCNQDFTLITYNDNGDQLGTDTVTVSEIQSGDNCTTDTPDDSNGDDGGTTEPGGDDEYCGCMFRTPEWEEHTGKLDEIISTIPPAPDWSEVANTFYDETAPKFINDMENMLGTAPEPSGAPELPEINEPNLEKPTGEQSPAENSGFTSDDIKDEAEEIEVREDSSGGFDITDPVDNLPSQEEFKDNTPEEQDIVAPEVPEVEGEAPEPPEVEGEAPEPEEQENVAPEPPEVEGEAPEPEEQENVAPEPEPEEENVAPTPGEEENTAPIPGEQENTAPTPDGDDSTAPVPSADGSEAPTPGETTESAPTPGG